MQLSEVAEIFFVIGRTKIFPEVCLRRESHLEGNNYVAKAMFDSKYVKQALRRK